MNIIEIVLTVVIVIALVFFSWKKPRLSSIIVWAMVATILLTSAMLIILPGEIAAKAIWLSLSVPIIWAGFQYWCYWADNKWTVLSSLIMTSCISAMLILKIDLVV